MLISFELASRKYAADMSRGISLAIPLRFAGAQPSFFGAPPARATTVTSGDWQGDTSKGGSCNVQEYRFVAHCNGTHTECVGHMVDEQVYVNDQLPGALLPATLVSVKPAAQAMDATLIQTALLRHSNAAFHKALILRTLPNGEDKLARSYDGPLPAPYLTTDAMRILVNAGVEHLLVDVPSLDPAEDEGRMAAHRVFWVMPEKSHSLADAKRPGGTVTELIFVPDTVQDGYYLLDLQIPAFMTDAAPSRPVIYPVG